MSLLKDKTTDLSGIIFHPAFCTNLVLALPPESFSNTCTTNHVPLSADSRLSLASLNGLRLVSSTLLNCDAQSILHSPPIGLYVKCANVFTKTLPISIKQALSGLQRRCV